jgi:acyl-CoA synthetase (AMP-forming)/AMP-acid ligase II
VAVVEDPALLAMLLLAALAGRRSLAFLPPAKERDVVVGPMRELGADVLISDQAVLEPDFLLAGERADATGTIDPLELVAPTRPTPDGPFLHLRTSGTTTGRPGWTRVHHADAILAARAMCRLPHYRSGKHRLVFLNPPLFHSYGMSAFLEYLHAGSAFALPSSGRAFFDFLKIGREVTTIEGVPDLYAGLARLTANPAPSLAHVGVGGDFPRRDDIGRLCRGRERGVTVSIRYGLTETPSAVAHNVFALDDAAADWTSSGVTTPLYRVRIIDESGAPCAPMAEGFIEVRGRHLADDGDGGRGVRTLRTEDLGFLDPDGRLHVTGRTKHFIKHRGFRISARTVEEGFLADDAVQDCRARHDGNQLVLEVALRHPVETAALLRAAATRLPPYALPDRIEVVPAIAKTVTGKTVRA